MSFKKRKDPNGGKIKLTKKENKINHKMNVFNETQANMIIHHQ